MKVKKMEFFDSHEQIKRIAKTGIKESQAEAIVYALSISRNTDITNLATKDQLSLVEQELKSEIVVVRAEIVAVEQSLRAEIVAVEQKLIAEIAVVRGEMAAIEQRLRAEVVAMEQRLMLVIRDSKFEMIKWLFGMWVTVLVALYFK